MKDNEMIGRRFGRLVVLYQCDNYFSPSGSSHKRFVCKCDCGVEKTVLKEHLTSGRTRSCGCWRVEVGQKQTHGEIHTRLYKIWGNMLNRCSNPNNPVWYNYGGRGIFVCDEWKQYEGFRDWANNSGYNDNLSIDRIDNNKGYSPDNCRWVDANIQNNNRRNNCYIEYKGEIRTISEWAAILNIEYHTLYNRIKRGWDVEDAFNKPLRRNLEL